MLGASWLQAVVLQQDLGGEVFCLVYICLSTGGLFMRRWIFLKYVIMETNVWLKNAPR